MTTYQKTIEISKEELDKIEELLYMTGDEIYDKYGMKRDETIIHTAKFDDGYFMDIKLVVCDGEDTPYTEAVLFNKNGYEVGHTEPFEEYDDCWAIHNNITNSTYVAIIKTAN